MAEPSERIDQAPSGAQVYTRDGVAWFRNKDGSLFGVPETSEGYQAALELETPASPDEVLTRLKQGRNAEIREHESGGRAFAESFGRGVADVALIPQRLLGDETTTAAGVLESLGGRPEAEQRETAEAFAEPMLGESSLGTAAADLVTTLIPGGLASKGLKGLSLGKRMAGLATIDALSGAAGGQAATAEGLWRAGEQMSADKLLAGAAGGALWGVALGGASELLGAGTSALRQRLANLDPVAAKGAMDQATGALGLLGGGRGRSGDIRIRKPSGADTPGSGFGMLPTGRWKGGVTGQMAGQAIDYVRKAGRKLIGEGEEKLARAEARAASIGREAEFAIKGRIREAGTAVKKTRMAMARADGDLRSATSRLNKVDETVQQMEQKALRESGRLQAREKTLETKWGRGLETTQAAKEQLRVAEAKADAALQRVDSRLAALDYEDDLLRSQAGDAPTPGQALRMNKLATRREALLSDKGALQTKLDVELRRAEELVERTGNDAAGALNELLETRKAWAETKGANKQRLAEIRAHAQEEVRLAEGRRADADAEYQQALRGEQSASEGASIIREQAQAQAEEAVAQGRLEARESFRKSPAFRAADFVLDTSQRGRNAALRAGHSAWAANQALTTAQDAHSEIERRTDQAILSATTKLGGTTWQNKSGLGDYRNFPDLQLRRPGETRKEAVLRRGDEIARARNNPEILIERLAEASEGFSMLGPGMTRTLIDKSMRALDYLNQWTWTRAVQNPLQPTKREAPGLDETALMMYERLWNATMFPGLLIDEVATWSIRSETVNTARMLYPDIHEGLRAQMSEQVFTGEFLPSYDQRIQLSMLLGVPDAQLNPNFLMTYQAMVDEAQAEREMATQSMASGKPGRPSGSPTISQQYRTTSQKVQEQ